jgi:hypothetical protein
MPNSPTRRSTPEYVNERTYLESDDGSRLARKIDRKGAC